MLERFAGRGRETIQFGQNEAAKLGHHHVGSEHFLLGLLRQDESTAAHALKSLGLTAERVRSEVLRMAPKKDSFRSGPFPFTPPAKRVLELAVQAADQRGQSHVEPEHILLATLLDRDGPAARVLVGCGGSLEQISDELHREASL